MFMIICIMYVTSRSHYNLLAPLLGFFTFSLVSEKEREAMKDERGHYGTVSKYNYGRMSISLKLRRILPPLVGLMVGRQMKYILKFSTGSTIQIFTYWVF